MPSTVASKLTRVCLLLLIALAVPAGAEEVSDKFMETYRAYDKAYNAGDLEKAVELAQKTLRMGREELGEDHPKIAVLEINLAHLLTLAGKLDAAESLFVEARKSVVRNQGEDAPSLETVYRDLGQIHAAQGKLEQARSDYSRAIRIAAKVDGSDHPAVAELLLKQAGVEAASGEFAAARKALDRALDIRKAAFGPRDVRTADVVMQIGMVAMRAGEYEDARQSYRSALALYKRNLDDRDARVIRAHSELAVLYELLGDSKRYEYHSDKVISLIADVEGDARALIIVQPDYPELPEDAPKEGWVLLEYSVTPEGRVDDPQVIEGEHQELFAEAAIAATDKWRYKPKVKEGKRVTQTNQRARVSFAPDDVRINVGAVE